MRKIKKGDEVIVIAGKDKGRRGKISRILLSSDRFIVERVIVEGINLIKKHVRPNPQRGTEGGIVEMEASIHASNVALYNPTKKAADRVGIKVLEDGRKVRYFKSNGEIIDL